ncbi:hypothetical protein RGR602_CH00887 [Rhizobium gallicum bv. gallicum R602sp]|uniref:Uncharacterized protein n=1 Tax=Rhizobium gallicum bv. gallicum R602sp TaxID=1041138 RepID=A0A0B4X110_9HYPH|nr:hypothetical protein RGR602_CH00887 [Rhizobium gallicum bv. gallicum R602sp]
MFEASPDSTRVGCLSFGVPAQAVNGVALLSWKVRRFLLKIARKPLAIAACLCNVTPD